MQIITRFAATARPNLRHRSLCGHGTPKRCQPPAAAGLPHPIISARRCRHRLWFIILAPCCFRMHQNHPTLCARIIAQTACVYTTADADRYHAMRLVGVYRLQYIEYYSSSSDNAVTCLTVSVFLAIDGGRGSFAFCNYCCSLATVTHRRTHEPLDAVR